MGIRIPRETIEAVKSIPIQKVAELYFDLERSGQDYLAHCSHGSDSDPSLHFYTSDNSFYCFGCEAGKRPVTQSNDVIGLVMWQDHCQFYEAVDKLCVKFHIQKARVELSREEIDRQKSLVLLQDKMDQYRRELVPSVREWFHDRGISDLSIEQWRLGSNDGHPVYPLFNASGVVTGFAQRKLDNEQGPKYINSRSSSLFKKNSLLYGLHNIGQSNYLVIGEGYNDAILLQQAGIPFVSTMGTALHQNQIDILRQYTKAVILWFDGDKPGYEATIKHGKELQEQGFLVKVVFIKDHDPDEAVLTLVNEGISIEAFIHKRAMLYSYFVLENKLALFSSHLDELRLKEFSEIKPLLVRLPDGDEKEMYLSRIQKMTGLSLDYIKEQIKERS